jgi:hypothetical protein
MSPESVTIDLSGLPGTTRPVLPYFEKLTSRVRIVAMFVLNVQEHFRNKRIRWVYNMTPQKTSLSTRSDSSDIFTRPKICCVLAILLFQI